MRGPSRVWRRWARWEVRQNTYGTGAGQPRGWHKRLGGQEARGGSLEWSRAKDGPRRAGRVGSRARGWAGGLRCRNRGGAYRLWWGASRRTAGLGWAGRWDGGMGWGWCWGWRWGWHGGWGPGHASPALQQAAIVVTEHQPGQWIGGWAPRGPGPPLLALPLLPPLLPLLGSLLPPPPLLLPLPLALLGGDRLPRLRSFQGSAGAICREVGKGKVRVCGLSKLGVPPCNPTPRPVAASARHL